MSGKNAERPEPAACHAFLAAGDTLGVPSPDRYGRSLADLIAMVGELRRPGQRTHKTGPLPAAEHRALLGRLEDFERAARERCEALRTQAQWAEEFADDLRRRGRQAAPAPSRVRPVPPVPADGSGFPGGRCRGGRSGRGHHLVQVAGGVEEEQPATPPQDPEQTADSTELGLHQESPSMPDGFSSRGSHCRVRPSLCIPSILV
ncbi:recombinase family protein [Streptosporangium sp. NPDC023825]|uniref:recombinase family protein n=1 Tax=Streptosporangium sp. NPDC023825 TaxID=3154909 RepID=UPI00343760A5